MESAKISSRNDLRQVKRAAADYLHSTFIAVRQLNRDRVEQLLDAVSDPFSPSYGQHLSFEEVGQLVKNEEAIHRIRKFIDHHNMSLISETPNGEYITVSAPISKWEEVLNTEFFEFETETNVDIGVNGGKSKLIRCLHYSLPKYLHGHVSAGKSYFYLFSDHCIHSCRLIASFQYCSLLGCFRFSSR